MAEIQTSELSTLRISQYTGSSDVGRLIQTTLDVWQEREVVPMQTLAAWPSSGAMLNWLGELLGLSRPLLAVSALPVFGFRNSSFGEAPFNDPNFITIAGATPMPDSQYLVALKARYLQLTGTPTLSSVLECFGSLNTTDRMRVTDNLDGSLTVSFIDQTDKNLFDKLMEIGAAAVPAGIDATSTKVDSF